MILFLFSIVANAAIKKNDAIVMPVTNDLFIGYSDLNELKKYIIGLVGALGIFFLKELYSWWKSRNSNEAEEERKFREEVRDQLSLLKEYALAHKYELQHLKENKASLSDVHEIIRERVDFIERKK